MDEVFESEIELFPNPTKDIVEIRLPESIEGEVQLEVYSANGRLVLSETSNASTNHTLDISEQPAGLYLVRIRSEKILIMKKLSKQ
jgi:hypothetical protein